MSIKDILLLEYMQEAKVLYHYTYWGALKSILEDNRLKAQLPEDQKTFKDEYPFDEDIWFERVSLTTNEDSEFFWVFGSARLIFDKHKLQQRFDMTEFKDPTLTTNGEKEVIIKEDIFPLDKYLMGIEAFPDEEEGEEMDEFLEIKKTLYPDLKILDERLGV